MGEVALSRSRTAEDYRETLETMLGELDRLTRIVEQLLQLSRLEAGALKTRFAPIPLGAVVEQVRHIYEPLAEARSVALAVDAGAGVPGTPPQGPGRSHRRPVLAPRPRARAR